MNKIRVMLAEDHITVREGVKLLLNCQSDLEVVGEAGNGIEAIQKAQASNPDVVVMDISMPEMNGLTATRGLLNVLPKVKILALTRHSDKAYLQQLLQAGASGYVLKQSAPAELVHAIRAVSSGGTYLDPAITEKALGNYLGRSSMEDLAEHHLSHRET